MSQVTHAFRQAMKVTLPKGTMISSTHPRAPRHPVASKRAQTITVHSVETGYVDVTGDDKRGRGAVVLPVLVWPGSGGYWRRAQVTPELAEVNGVGPIVLPDLDEWHVKRLDFAPTLERTDRWA